MTSITKDHAGALTRRMPIGAEVQPHATSFRVWAPKRGKVELAILDASGKITQRVPLASEAGGYFAGTSNAAAGTRYGFLLDDDSKVYPDPASRFQPDGPHGPSQVVDPLAFSWRDQAWSGLKLKG